MAGLGTFAGGANFAVHRDFGYLFGLLTIVLIVLGLIGRLPRLLVGVSVLLLVLFAMQSVFVLMRTDAPAIAALHRWTASSSCCWRSGGTPGPPVRGGRRSARARRQADAALTSIRTGVAGRRVTAGLSGIGAWVTFRRPNRWAMVARTRIASCIAKEAPMHLRGPSPKGR